jgi:hypothetical protein
VNRQQLAHLLRSACAITDDEDVLVLGSQSILGSFDVRVRQHVHDWLDHYEGGNGLRPSGSRPTATGAAQPLRTKGVPGAGESTPRERPDGDVTL